MEKEELKQLGFDNKTIKFIENLLESKEGQDLLPDTKQQDNEENKELHQLVNESIINLVYVPELIKYYQELGGLTFIGMNDSMGVNTTALFSRKTLTRVISDKIKTERNDRIFDACSMIVNKTEHIDQILTHNLTAAELRISQLYGIRTALLKIAIENKVPSFISNPILDAFTVSLYPHYKPEEEDFDLHITDTLKEAKEPTFLYTSGANNLMRTIGNNPFNLPHDVKHQTPAYFYSQLKANDPKTTTEIEDKIRTNFEHILGINPSTDIYALGIFNPASLRKEELKLFRDLVQKYNEILQRQCQNYGVTFINTELLGSQYNNSNIKFHLNNNGNSALASYIIEAMYERKIKGNIPPRSIETTSIEFSQDNTGCFGMMLDAKTAQIEADDRKRDLSGYTEHRAKKISFERKLEWEVFSETQQEVAKKIKSK